MIIQITQCLSFRYYCFSNLFDVYFEVTLYKVSKVLPSIKIQHSESQVSFLFGVSSYPNTLLMNFSILLSVIFSSKASHLGQLPKKSLGSRTSDFGLTTLEQLHFGHLSLWGCGCIIGVPLSYQIGSALISLFLRYLSKSF